MTYEEVHSVRVKWSMERKSGLGAVRLMTYANKPDSGLDILLTSARWSGISIKVAIYGVVVTELLISVIMLIVVSLNHST